jgi:hypothetical protein
MSHLKKVLLLHVLQQLQQLNSSDSCSSVAALSRHKPFFKHPPSSLNPRIVVSGSSLIRVTYFHCPFFALNAWLEHTISSYVCTFPFSMDATTEQIVLKCDTESMHAKSYHKHLL